MSAVVETIRSAPASTSDGLRSSLRAFRAAHLERELTVGGVLWQYLTGGQATDAMVLLPGGTRRPDTYFVVAEALEQRHRVLVPSYPAVPTMRELIGGVAAILEAEHLERATVFGSSFGGYVAQCFVRAHPDRVSHLILSHTGTPGGTPLVLRLAALLMRWLPESLVRALTLRNWLRWLTVAPTERHFWRELMADLALERLTKRDLVSALENVSDFARQYHFGPTDLTRWSGRTLLLESDDDQVFGPAQRAALRGLYPEAEVHTFHGAGHTAVFTRTNEYVAAIEGFLERTALGHDERLA